jgi:hypothetical protein
MTHRSCMMCAVVCVKKLNEFLICRFVPRVVVVLEKTYPVARVCRVQHINCILIAVQYHLIHF